MHSRAQGGEGSRGALGRPASSTLAQEPSVPFVRPAPTPALTPSLVKSSRESGQLPSAFTAPPPREPARRTAPAHTLAPRVTSSPSRPRGHAAGRPGRSGGRAGKDPVVLGRGRAGVVGASWRSEGTRRRGFLGGARARGGGASREGRAPAGPGLLVPGQPERRARAQRHLSPEDEVGVLFPAGPCCSSLPGPHRAPWPSHRLTSARTTVSRSTATSSVRTCFGEGRVGGAPGSRAGGGGACGAGCTGTAVLLGCVRTPCLMARLSGGPGAPEMQLLVF